MTFVLVNGRTTPEANCPAEPVRLRDNSARSAGKTSDRELLAAIARGDQQAMRRLYERHSEHVYRFACRLGVDESAAEDVVSEVFFEVWRCADAFESRAQVSTWLLAITRNRALSAFRRRPHELPDIASTTIVDETDGPEAAIQKKQAASGLIEALRKLSPAQRRIIDLVYYHEKSITEIARILNIPAGTVKTRVFYARKRLAQLLAQSDRDAVQLVA